MRPPPHDRALRTISPLRRPHSQQVRFQEGEVAVLLSTDAFRVGTRLERQHVQTRLSIAIRAPGPEEGRVTRAAGRPGPELDREVSGLVERECPHRGIAEGVFDAAIRALRFI